MNHVLFYNWTLVSFPIKIQNKKIAAAVSYLTLFWKFLHVLQKKEVKGKRALVKKETKLSLFAS